MMTKMGTLKSTRFTKLCSNLLENALKLILRPSTKLKFQPSPFMASLQMQDTAKPVMIKNKDLATFVFH